MIIRDEQIEDEAAIRDVVAAAFGRQDEARLIDRLRGDGDLVMSLVASDGQAIVGSAVFSRMTAPFPALALGPLAILPEQQRRGLGGRLVTAGIARAQKARWQGLFVLGNPLYYARFGFDPALASGFTCRYAGPHLMALALQSNLPAVSGAVSYAPAFALLD
jgi:putative acetyltransferase